MNAWSRTKAFLSRREAQRGQVLIILAFGLVFLAALVGLMIDVGIYTTNNIIAHNNAAVGCVTAAEAYRRGGSASGAFADIAATSFYPTKNLGGIGEGGMVLTKRADLYERAKKLRVHGMGEQRLGRLRQTLS